MGKLRFFLLTLVCAVSLSSCTSCHDNEPPEPVEHTLIMYFPWSTDLTYDFINNIEDMKEAIAANGLHSQRVIVYLANSPYEARLLEIGADCKETVLKTYDNPPMTSAAGISSMLADIAGIAPASRYSMTIGCHGLGWIPVSGQQRALRKPARFHWEGTAGPRTRFFGGLSPEYQTDISTLREAIEDAGMKMDYILFDDCYMSNVEVAYELREVTGHLIASTSEIMSHGMPYDIIGGYLLGTPDYEKICEGFLSFYSDYPTPCGSIAVTDCSQMENLASIMREINSRHTFDTEKLPQLQRLDGYIPSMFFDMESYVENLCGDQELLQTFRDQMQRTVIAKACTPTIYTAITYEQIRVDTFSGLTISDPTENSMATYALSGTSWHKATH